MGRRTAGLLPGSGITSRHTGLSRPLFLLGLFVFTGIATAAGATPGTLPTQPPFDSPTPGNSGHTTRVCPQGSPNRDCGSLSLADTLAGARDGDTIILSPGVYHEAGVLNADDVTIRGEPGAHIQDATAEDKASLVIKGDNTIVSGIECSGARVPDHNGACIRLEGSNLLVTGVYFHHNENGILAGPNPRSDVTIEDSEFAYNGDGSGKTHNIYIGQVRSFTLRGCLSHHATQGHLVKSRALTNTISYNRLMDGPDGESSYAIDIPDGGTTYIIGNVIQKGPKSANSTIISYGAEGVSNPGTDLYVVNNTIINDRPAGAIVVHNWSEHPARIVNNIIVGNVTLSDGPVHAQNNLVSRQYDVLGLLRYTLSNPRAVWENPGRLLTMYRGIDLKFADPQLYDYRLSITSPAIDAGIDPGTANGVSLRPDMEYSQPLNLVPRPLAGPLDIGAYEYVRP